MVGGGAEALPSIGIWGRGRKVFRPYGCPITNMPFVIGHLFLRGDAYYQWVIFVARYLYLVGCRRA